MSATRDHVLHLENGRLASDTPREHVDLVAHRALTEAGEAGIVIHFHGGLVDEAAGRDIAARLLPVYRDAGAYPIFLVWESGLLESLGNNLGEIAREKLFQKVWKRVEELVKRKFAQGEGERAAGILRQIDSRPIDEAIDEAIAAEDPEPLRATEEEAPAGLTELSDAERRALETELQLDTELMAETQRVSAGLRDPSEVESEIRSRAATVRGSTESLMDPRALDRLVERPQPGARGVISTIKMVKAVVQIVANVVSRYVRGRHHGFHATVVEEILRGFYVANAGKLVWSTIKKDTGDSFGPDGSSHGGTALIEALAEEIDPENPPRITLVGHSTGAIYISEWLDATQEHLPDVRHGVVFLAPASTFERTADTLERHRERLQGLRMFTMTDGNERKDRLVPVIYPHSLLYFVSGVVEDDEDAPLVGMQRFFDEEKFPPDRFPAVEAVRAFCEDGVDRVVWSVSSGDRPGRCTASLKHGDFDNDEKTLDSVAHVIERGFEA